MNPSRHLALTALALFILVTILPERVIADEVRVGTGQPFSSLKAALQAANPGDTILIEPGEYAEGNLLIDKSVTLRGRDFPVLNGEGKFEVITITAPDVTIEGLEIRDTGTGSLEDIAGIKVKDSSGARIIGNRLRHCTFAIYLSQSKDCVISGNDIRNSANDEQTTGNGIHFWHCSKVTVTQNTVQGQRDGIYFEFTTESLIEDNQVFENFRYGLHFMFSHSNAYHRNTFQHNGAGVAVMYSRQVEMSENHFLSNWGGASYGLLLKEMTDGTLNHNIFEKNTVALTMDGSNRMTIRENEFRSNGRAINLNSNCSANHFLSNNFIANSFDFTARGELGDNRLLANYWDRYEGYDLARDGTGDVPYRPVSLYATMVNRIPPSILLMRSPVVHLLDQAEKIFPSITPETVIDGQPAMRPYPLTNSWHKTQ